MSDFSIHPVYLSARAAIVAPERAIPVSLYSTQKWLPRLGPERWCLIMLLRSLSIDSQRRTDGTKRVVCSWRHLSDLLDVHEETIASWLKHQPIPNDKPWRRIISNDEKSESLSLFIPRLRYAYETRKGKTRRTGFLLEILMEDPVVPEDEMRLQSQIEVLRLQQGSLGLENFRSEQYVPNGNSNLPSLSQENSNRHSSDLHYVNQDSPDLPGQANPAQLGLHKQSVNPNNSDLLTAVKLNNPDLSSYVNPLNTTSHNDETEFYGKNVNELDILIQQLKRNNIKKNLRRDAFEPVIKCTETLLDDNHSTGMLFKVLNVLYPERLDLFVAAVRVALEVSVADSNVNRGAVFVRTLRDFADIAGIDLGFKRESSEMELSDSFSGNPGSPEFGQFERKSAIAPPLITEAIWAETQSNLRRQMTQATYDAIIQGTTLVEQNDNVYVIGVHSDMAKEWLENRLHDIVQRALSNVIGSSVVVQFRLTK